jgi:hypothetical protein
MWCHGRLIIIQIIEENDCSHFMRCETLSCDKEMYVSILVMSIALQGFCITFAYISVIKTGGLRTSLFV